MAATNQVLYRASVAQLRRPILTPWRTLTTSAAWQRQKSKGSPTKYTNNTVGGRLREQSKRLANATFDSPNPTPPTPAQAKTFDKFRGLVHSRLDLMVVRTDSWHARQAEWKAFGVKSKLDFDKESKLFRLAVDRACDLATETGATSRTDNPLFWSLRKGFVDGDNAGLAREILYAFQNFLMRSKFTKDIATTHQNLADFRFPYEWFPATRALQRTVHLHVGPTNSGKTYNALKALENAKSGIYAGPLRLLAHEIYTRFQAKGKSCALITGEEQRIPKDSDIYFRSCTVEMTPLNSLVDVAVIDEIQMIGDEERGWAWTQAVLGVQAREVHLCGEERTVDLIKALCATTGDKLEIHRYNRLSPLDTMTHSFKNDFSNLEKGDCVVTFSRLGIHSLKKEIEEKTGKQVAIIYGSLPPETRAQQAALFNDPDNEYDYLVASDAIGMGLNLEIKRVIFQTVFKRNAVSYRQMEISEIKQIGGRAGRFRTANHAIKAAASQDDIDPDPTPSAPAVGGLITCLEEEDLAIVQQAFRTDAPQLKTAGIQPPPSVLERISSYFPPNTPLTYILMRLRDLAQISSRYHLCTTGEMLKIANIIQPFPMPIYDRCVFLNAPVALREASGIRVLQAFAKCVSDMKGGDLLDMDCLDLEIIDETADTYPMGSGTYLTNLEALHKALTLYLWLSYRYSGVFRSQHLAFHVKGLIEAKIDEQLAQMNISPEQLTNLRRLSAIKARKAKVRQEEIAGAGEGDFAEAISEESEESNESEGGEEGPVYEENNRMENDSRASISEIDPAKTYV